MKLTITLDLDDDAQAPHPDHPEDVVPLVDPHHPMGVTEAGHLVINNLLVGIGADDVDVEQSR